MAAFLTTTLLFRGMLVRLQFIHTDTETRRDLQFTLKPGNFGIWNGILLVSRLVSQSVHRCVPEGNILIEEEPLLSSQGRVRNFIQEPDSSIYVSVENPGRIIRIQPDKHQKIPKKAMQLNTPPLNWSLNR